MMVLGLGATRPFWAALAAGLAITFAVTWLLFTTTAERELRAFEAAARQAEAAILAKVETSVALLRGTAGLFAAKQNPVTVGSFRDYVQRLALRERYPGILGIGFSRRVMPGETTALEEEMRAQGHPSFRVWPERDGERHSILFLEPLDKRNQAAIGYDMSSNAVRREAMDRARDTASAAASGVVELVQEIDERKQPGFLIYLPVFEGGVMPTHRDERRQLLRGYAYSPIRAVDFLSQAFAHEANPLVGVEVHHGHKPGSGTLLYERGIGHERSRFSFESTADVAGQPWTFVFRSRETHAGALLMPLVVALAGLALSFALAVLIARERSARAALTGALEAERAARAEAERANRMKDEFLATLSHELRTPLHSILGWTAMLKRSELREEQRRQGIEVVDRSARTQARLIEDLLDMNRIVSGKLALEMQPVDPAALLADALRSLRPNAEAKGVALETDVEPEPMRVRGDPARLLQVMANLLANAVKFTPAGGRVEVTLARAAGRVRLVVRDTGEGIDPEFLGRMFTRFAQADGSISRRHGGLGLGLAIVRQLVELHGGTVRAESAGRDHGSTFTVELPLLAAEEVAAAAAAEPVATPEALRGVRVLAVDDDDDSRELIRTLLAGAGAEVRTAASAAEALRALREAPPDVLLSDIGMPGTDGYTLLRKVRSLPEHEGGSVPAAAITAYARDTDRAAALEAGFDLHLVKPLRVDQLVEAVSSLAGRR